MREFVAEVQAAISGASSPEDACTAVEQRFAELLGDSDWLPDFYVLIPPRDDIHRVRSTSAETSVSIHLLTNDTGCVWRHAYDPASGHARPFRSGYLNVPCEENVNP